MGGPARCSPTRSTNGPRGSSPRFCSPISSPTMCSTAGPRPPRASRVRGGSATWWRHLPAVVLATLFLLPLWFLLSGSLRRPGLPPPVAPELFPSDPSVESYRRAFDLVDLDRQLLNSLFVVAVAVPLTV